MRYFRIFLLHLQQTLEQRSFMFVYFLMSLVSPFLLILFWQGATTGGRSVLPGWNFSAIVSYYFYFTLLNGLLMAHPENTVARHHIKEGDLVMYLLKPLPYFLQVFFMEFSWRLVRLCFGIVTIILFYAFFQHSIMGLHNTTFAWFLIFIVLGLGFMVSFVMKMIMGITAFWLIDTTGLYQLMEVVLAIFAGFILPLAFLPSVVSSIATVLPFAYIIYFPVLVLEGKIQVEGIFHVIFIQLIWITLLYLIYQFLWKKGIQKFTAVGQ